MDEEYQIKIEEADNICRRNACDVCNYSMNDLDVFTVTCQPIADRLLRDFCARKTRWIIGFTQRCSSECM